MTHTFTPSTAEAQAGGALLFRDKHGLCLGPGCPTNADRESQKGEGNGFEENSQKKK